MHTLKYVFLYDQIPSVIFFLLNLSLSYLPSLIFSFSFPSLFLNIYFQLYSADKSLNSLQLWKKSPLKNDDNNFDCNMDERVVTLFSILSTFLMFDNAVCADPQTLVPCWRVMRMVRTYVQTYMLINIRFFFEIRI